MRQLSTFYRNKPSDINVVCVAIPVVICPVVNLVCCRYSVARETAATVPQQSRRAGADQESPRRANRLLRDGNSATL